MNLICSVVHDCRLLPYFLKYYYSCGVSRFIFGVWNGRNNPLWDELVSCTRDYPVVVIPSFSEPFNGELDGITQDRLRLEFVQPNEWYAVADLDEFHRIPGHDDFRQAVVAAEHEGAHLIRGYFLDRFSSDGVIPETLDYSKPLGVQFPYGCEFTKKILKGCTQKVQLANAMVAIGPGHHPYAGKPWNLEGQVHHFKWFGRLFAEQRNRAESYKLQRKRYRIESVRLLRYFEQHGWSVPIEDRKLRVQCVKGDVFATLYAY